MPSEISKKTSEAEARSFEKLIALEDKRMALEASRLDLARQQDQNTYNFSLKALEYRQENEKNKREYDAKRDNKVLALMIVSLISLLLVVIFAFLYNKEQFLYECLKVVVPLIIGWFGGNAWTKYKYSEKLNGKEQLHQNQIQNYISQY